MFQSCRENKSTYLMFNNFHDGNCKQNNAFLVYDEFHGANL